MPKGSGRKLYPREGSGEKAGSENAGRPYREADMRRDAWDEGACLCVYARRQATQSEVLQLSGASRRFDGYAWKTAGNTPGDPSGAPKGEGKPQGAPNTGRKSAEGIVGVQSGKASEALQGRKAEKLIGQAV